MLLITALLMIKLVIRQEIILLGLGLLLPLHLLNFQMLIRLPSQ